MVPLRGISKMSPIPAPLWLPLGKQGEPNMPPPAPISRPPLVTFFHLSFPPGITVFVTVSPCPRGEVLPFAGNLANISRLFLVQNDPYPCDFVTAMLHFL